jgi:2-C-methyl-D-erythritol 4-phosphate cytidylyltransferase
MTTTSKLPRLGYRPDEVAQIIGLGATRTRQYIALGLLASVRIGTCIIVTEDAIRAFLSKDQPQLDQNGNLIGEVPNV